MKNLTYTLNLICEKEWMESDSMIYRPGKEIKLLWFISVRKKSVCNDHIEEIGENLSARVQ